MGAFSLPTTGPSETQNPLLDSIHEAVRTGDLSKLSPEAHEAIRRSGVIPQIAAKIDQPPAQPAPQIVSKPGPGPLAVPQPTAAPAPGVGANTPAGALASGPPPPNPLTPLESAQQHVRDVQAQGTGISRIHNPLLRGLATAGDIVAGTFAPRAEQLIPGTIGHHALDIGQAENEVAQEQGNLNQPVERRLKSAQATEQESLPAFHESQNEVKRLTQEEQAVKDKSAAELGQAKNETEQEKIKGQAEAAKATHAQKLASAGFKEDETGKIVPLEYGEMSETQQAVHDLKSAQSEAAEATASYKKAQAENQPQVAALQLARLQSAQQAHQIALQRLGLSEATYNARYLGTGKNGEPLAGAPLTEQGQTVGSVNARGVLPTAVQRNQAGLGTSAQEQLNDMRNIVQKRPDIFGPLAGRKTDVQVWLGSEDPDAAAFRTARTILGDHEAGTFGGRSNQTVKDLEQAAGLFKTNPDAIKSSLGQLEKANKGFIQRGTPRTVGSNAAAAQPVVPPPAQGGGVEEYVRDANGKLVKKNAPNY